MVCHWFVRTSADLSAPYDGIRQARTSALTSRKPDRIRYLRVLENSKRGQFRLTNALSTGASQITESRGER